MEAGDGLMDAWFFAEVSDDETAPVRRDVTRWLVTAGAISSLLVALLTVAV